jgi:hypothetical protein
MARPKIRPITPEAAAAGVAAVEQGSGVVFVPAGAATYETKNGIGKRWSARVEFMKAAASMGGKKDEPNEDIVSYYVMLKVLPFTKVDADKQVPAGTVYNVRMNVNYAKIAEGDEMSIRNEGVVTSLFASVGVDIKQGITQQIIESAFPEESKKHETTLRGQRAFVTLSLNPSNKEGGTGYLNADRFMPDSE